MFWDMLHTIDMMTGEIYGTVIGTCRLWSTLVPGKYKQQHLISGQQL